jgi:hypothetical protein
MPPGNCRTRLDEATNACHTPTIKEDDVKLLTKATTKLLPPIGSTDGQPETERKVPVKFFDPSGAGTWFALEFDPEERSFFGYVTGLGEDEFGYFSLDELEQARGRFGLGIERDIHWNPTTTLAEVLARRAS